VRPIRRGLMEYMYTYAHNLLQLIAEEIILLQRMI